MLKQLFGKAFSFIKNLFGRKTIRRKTKSYPVNSGGFAAIYNREIIEDQQAKIERLSRKLAAEEGQFEMVDGERKYVIDDDQHRFQDLRHRNLGGIILQALRLEGLQVERTTDNDRNGDLKYADTPENYEKMKTAFAKLQSKFDAINKVKKERKQNGK